VGIVTEVKCARPDCVVLFARKSVRHRFCSEDCRTLVPDTGPAKPSVRVYPPTEFVAVDGEGTGDGKDHVYVLLGVGQVQREWMEGVTDITEIFSFLYARFKASPGKAFVGFFLSYDFNMIMRLLPRERASMLFSAAGKAKRARRDNKFLGPFPVEYEGWEFDMLGMKRLKLRPLGKNNAWMYICDAGPFFQASLLTVINPATATDPVLSPDEYAMLATGKERRDIAALDDDMRKYNRMENHVFEMIMGQLDEGFRRAGVRLGKGQWFGPGQAAQAWMRKDGKLDRPMQALREKKGHYDKALKEAGKATYTAGWFEIPVHGIVSGTSYEYDVNSAYPYIISQLPCLCGKWRHGQGSPSYGPFMIANLPVIVRAIVRGGNKYLGPLPYRNQDGRILRPRYTNGYYWMSEIDAARRAGLIDSVTVLEYWQYYGCSHSPPLASIRGLYQERLRVGKDTPHGKACKHLYNSVYGKFAQGDDNCPFGHPFYASLITSGCRTLMLDAIATHPMGASAVVMVATDGIYFTDPHPGLEDDVNDRLGGWSRETHDNLTLFKPGVYWDDAAREAIARGDAPHFKARGISARDFARSIGDVDRQFMAWEGRWLEGLGPSATDWPAVEFTSRFAQTSIIQALAWTEGIEDPVRKRAVYRSLAGRVQSDRRLVQNSYPGVKRNPVSVRYDGRVWRSEPWAGGPHWPVSKPYDGSFGLTDEDTAGYGGEGSFVSPDGPVLMGFRSAIGVG